MIISTFLTYIINYYKKGNAQSLEAATEYYMNCGLQAADYDIDAVNQFGIDRLIKMHNDFNLKASTYIYGFDYDYKNAELVESIKDITKTQIEYCTQLDSKIFMPVPCIINKFKDNDERLEARKSVCDYMAYVCDLVKPYGITGVLENHSSMDYVNTCVEDFDYYLSNIPDMRYVLDTGNYSYIGKDMMVACEKFKNKTEHIHLKDFKAPVNPENMIYTHIGDGVVENIKAIKTLQAVGYDGALSIETTGIEKSIEFLKNNFDCREAE